MKTLILILMIFSKQIHATDLDDLSYKLDDLETEQIILMTQQPVKAVANNECSDLEQAAIHWDNCEIKDKAPAETKQSLINSCFNNKKKVLGELLEKCN